MIYYYFFFFRVTKKVKYRIENVIVLPTFGLKSI